MQVLLIEPDGLVRSTVASVCREREIVRMHQVASLAMGEKWLKTWKADGLMMSLSEAEAAVELLTRLRAGEFSSEADIPVAVMSTACDVDILTRLKDLRVGRFILQPFKLRDVIRTVEQLWPLEPNVAVQNTKLPDHNQN